MHLIKVSFKSFYVSTDDGEASFSFFENLGLSLSTSSQELSEGTVNGEQFMGTLTPRQVRQSATVMATDTETGKSVSLSWQMTPRQV